MEVDEYPEVTSWNGLDQCSYGKQYSSDGKNEDPLEAGYDIGPEEVCLLKDPHLINPSVNTEQKGGPTVSFNNLNHNGDDNMAEADEPMDVDMDMEVDQQPSTLSSDLHDQNDAGYDEVDAVVAKTDTIEKVAHQHSSNVTNVSCSETLDNMKKLKENSDIKSASSLRQMTGTIQQGETVKTHVTQNNQNVYDTNSLKCGMNILPESQLFSDVNTVLEILDSSGSLASKSEGTPMKNSSILVADCSSLTSNVPECTLVDTDVVRTSDNRDVCTTSKLSDPLKSDVSTGKALNKSRIKNADSTPLTTVGESITLNNQHSPHTLNVTTEEIVSEKGIISVESIINEEQKQDCTNTENEVCIENNENVGIGSKEASMNSLVTGKRKQMFTSSLDDASDDIVIVEEDAKKLEAGAIAELHLDNGFTITLSQPGTLSSDEDSRSNSPAVSAYQERANMSSPSLATPTGQTPPSLTPSQTSSPVVIDLCNVPSPSLSTTPMTSNVYQVISAGGQHIAIPAKVQTFVQNSLPAYYPFGGAVIAKPVSRQPQNMVSVLTSKRNSTSVQQKSVSNLFFQSTYPMQHYPNYSRYNVQQPLHAHTEQYPSTSAADIKYHSSKIPQMPIEITSERIPINLPPPTLRQIASSAGYPPSMVQINEYLPPMSHPDMWPRPPKTPKLSAVPQIIIDLWTKEKEEKEANEYEKLKSAKKKDDSGVNHETSCENNEGQSKDATNLDDSLPSKLTQSDKTVFATNSGDAENKIMTEDVNKTQSSTEILDKSDRLVSNLTADDDVLEKNSQDNGKLQTNNNLNKIRDETANTNYDPTEVPEKNKIDSLSEKNEKVREAMTSDLISKESREPKLDLPSENVEKSRDLHDDELKQNEKEAEFSNDVVSRSIQSESCEVKTSKSDENNSMASIKPEEAEQSVGKAVKDKKEVPVSKPADTQQKVDDDGEDDVSNGSTNLRPVAKFIFKVGLDLAREQVYYRMVKWLLRRVQGRKIDASGLSHLLTLEKALDDKIEKNDACGMRFGKRKCKGCNFATESLHVMEYHKEEPHIDLHHTVMKCQSCDFETRLPLSFTFHMESEHGRRGRVLEPPMFHECHLCPFENKIKSAVTKHKFRCSNKFKPDQHLKPDYDMENPCTLCAETLFKVSQEKQKHDRRIAMREQYNKLQQASRSQPVAVNQVGNQPTAKNFIPTSHLQTFVLPSQQIFSTRPTNKLLPVQSGLSVVSRVNVPNNNLQMILGSKPMSNLAKPEQLPVVAKTGNMSKFNSFSIKQQQRPGTSNAKKPLLQADATSCMQNLLNLPAPQNISCEICNGMVRNMHNFQVHLKMAHDVKVSLDLLRSPPKLHCPRTATCQSRFYTAQGAVKHVATEHVDNKVKGPSLARCHFCGIFCTNIVAHIVFNHKPSVNMMYANKKCHFCPPTQLFQNIFTNLKGIHEHLMQCHGVESSTLSQKNACYVCGMRFHTKFNVLRHLEMLHKIQMETPCPGCNKHFGNTALSAHVIESNHIPTVKEMLVNGSCGVCNVIMPNNQLRVYILHLEENHGIIVDKGSYKLREHVELHKDALSCSLCPAKFSTIGTLSSHFLESHTFSCKLCSNKFTSVNFLQTHYLNKHRLTKERLIRFYPESNIFSGGNQPEDQSKDCEICNKRFQTPDSYITHVQRYHLKNCSRENRQKDCEICNRRFQSPDNYLSHVQRKHLKKCSVFIKRLSRQQYRKYVSVVQKRRLLDGSDVAEVIEIDDDDCNHAPPPKKLRSCEIVDINGEDIGSTLNTFAPVKLKEKAVEIIMVDG